MKHAPPFSYPADGRLLVGADGQEIVAYNGYDESPLWLRKHREEVEWVFVADDGLVAVGATSAITMEDDGTIQQMIEFDPRHHNPIAASFTPFLAECCIATSDAVFVFDMWEPDNVREMAVEQIKNVAINDEGEVLVLSTGGTTRLFDDESQLIETVHGPHFGSASWAFGTWWLADAQTVYTWIPGESPDVAFATEVEIDEIFVSEDGRLIAIRTIDHTVFVYTTDGESLCEASYPGRIVGPICFDDEAVVGIGLDLADANKVFLRTGALHRTDTHPDRAHNSWVCGLFVDATKAVAYLEEETVFDRFDENEWREAEPAEPGRATTFRETIDIFHRKLVGLPDESIGQHLRNGPLPQTESECIYAAQRTIPLLESASVDNEPGMSARIRLRAIRRIMEPLDQTPEILVALRQIDETITEAERRTRNDTILGCGCLLLVLALVVGGVVYWLF